MFMGGSLFGGGFALAAAGVYTHNLPMMYAGNLVCGIGYVVLKHKDIFMMLCACIVHHSVL